jgi:hypothetical protein
MTQAIGLFVAVMGEFPEMLYQYDQDNIFDSTKFGNRFKISAPTLKQG